jgi:peptide/nickel transport system permease protein
MVTKPLAGQLQARHGSRGLWTIAALRLLRKPKAVVALTLILVLYGSGIFANLIAPHNYTDQDLTAVRQAPSSEHLLGTDYVGRDILSRLVFSMRSNLILTMTSILTGSLLLGITRHTLRYRMEKYGLLEAHRHAPYPAHDTPRRQ